MSQPVTARPKLNDFRQSLGYISVRPCTRSCANKHKAKGGGGGDIFCGGGTKSASRMCPPGHNSLADFVRGDNNWGGQNPL